MSKISFKIYKYLHELIFQLYPSFLADINQFYKISNKQNSSQWTNVRPTFIIFNRNQFTYKPPSRGARFSQISILFSAVPGIFFWAKSLIFISPPPHEQYFSQMSLVPLRAHFRHYPSFLIETNQLHRWAEFHVTLLSPFSIVPSIHHF